MTASRSLTRDLLHGALGFAAVSLASFSIWAFAAGAFRRLGGEPAMYVAIAVVFLGLSGVVLGPLAGGTGRFYRVFLPAFSAYAVLWSVAWFALPNRSGEWLGALLGCAAFVGLARWRLGTSTGWLALFTGFFLLHTAGYFAGSWAMYDFWLARFKAGNPDGLTGPQAAVLAKLSWGLCYGLGFGAGLGWLFHRARSAA